MSKAKEPGFLSASAKVQKGLTKREYFAAVAMQGLLANSYSDGVSQPLSTATAEQIAQIAVNTADALIKELYKHLEYKEDE